MKIQFKVTEEDRIAFNIQHLNKLPRIKKVQTKNRIIIASLYAGIACVWVFCKPEHWPIAWILAFLGVLWYFFYPTVWERRMIKKIKRIYKDKASLNQELEFKSNSIWAKNDLKEGEIPWTAVTKIISNEKYIFLYLSEEDAIIIPRREFADQALWTEILESIQQLFKTTFQI